MTRVRFIEPDQTQSVAVEFRFLLTTTEARLQWRGREQDAFMTIQQVQHIHRRLVA